MKLVIGGATGLVGGETLRQALQSNAITSIITISRKPCSLPGGVDQSKLKELVLNDFLSYTEDAKGHLADADACIWTIAITPSKSKDFPWEEVKKVCLDYAVTALETMIQARTTTKPLRFIYYSGAAAERDQTKTPSMMPEMVLMRGQAENELLARAAASQGAAEVCCVKPGLIMGPNFVPRGPLQTAAVARGIPSIKLDECVAATFNQVREWPPKEPLDNEDLQFMGRTYLASHA